jgi:hypothetical protein
VLKVLSLEQMEKRVKTSAAFLKMTINKRRSFLCNIIIMEELAVSMATPKTRTQSMQWSKKRQTRLH